MAEEIRQRWLPIESNPDVMNEFLHKLGVPKSWAMTDVFGLDPELLAMLPSPVVSLMLLFPITEKYVEFCMKQDSELVADDHKDLYYMKQTISNACGTVAMIHAVANNRDKIQLNEGQLKEFLDSTKNMNPEERAVALEGSTSVCEVHDEVAQVGQTAAPNLDDKVEYHFVAFIEKDGNLYELDGRKKAPIKCGTSSSSTFLEDAAKECKNYMARDPNNINFTMLALAKVEN